MPKYVEFEIVPRSNYRGDDVRITTIVRAGWYSSRILKRHQFTVLRSNLERALKKADLLEHKEVFVERAENGSELVALSTMYSGLLRVSRTSYSDRLFNGVGTRLKKALGLTSK